MKEFRLWYQAWVQKQELTITHKEVAEAAFEAGQQSVLSKTLPEKEINTHKGNF